MSRLTKKFNGEYYHKEAKTLMFNNETDYNAIQKLGKLEDIMENHNVNDYRMLGFLLKEYERLSKQEVELYADLGMFQKENINLTKDIEKYWNLEEELGCPLEVVFKVLLKNEGIRTIKNDTYYIHNIVRLSTGNLAFELESAHYLYLKDYQKTWWLKGEK